MEDQLREALFNFTEGDLSALNKANGCFIEVDRSLFPSLDIFEFDKSEGEESNESFCLRVSKLLTEKRKEAFILYYTGHSMASIAARFGVSKSTIQDHLKLARAKLEPFKMK